MRQAKRPRLLVLGGLDPTGAAGVVADLAVAHRHGVETAAVITALTSQDERGLRHLVPTDPVLLREQLADALAGSPVRAIKTGLLPDSATIEAVAAALADVSCPVVVDPVLAVSAGGWRMDKGAQETLRTSLLPLATLVTPNDEELRALAPEAEDTEVPARALLGKEGAEHVLLTGGHGTGDVVRECLVGASETHTWEGPRFDGAPFRGTGCALSTAIAAQLARGLDLKAAITEAHAYVRALIALASAARVHRLPHLAVGVEVHSLTDVS